MNDYQQNLSIKAWAEADRPREKMLHQGKGVLSEAELIAILIGSGSPKESAVDLSKRILRSVNHNLVELGKLTIRDLMKFNGIGEAKAISIVAALELGRRRNEAEVVIREKVTASQHVFEIFEPMMSDLPHEEFWVLLLNRANKVIGKKNVSKGGVSGTIVDTKIIFKLAVENLASTVILCHNHPSGNLKPSHADVKLTKRLVEAGRMMEIPVADHIIIAERGYFSFMDEGMM